MCAFLLIIFCSRYLIPGNNFWVANVLLIVQLAERPASQPDDAIWTPEWPPDHPLHRILPVYSVLSCAHDFRSIHQAFYPTLKLCSLAKASCDWSKKQRRVDGKPNRLIIHALKKQKIGSLGTGFSITASTTLYSFDPTCPNISSNTE